MSYSTTPYQFYVGVDLGKSQDFTAIAIVEPLVWTGNAWASRDDGTRWQKTDARLPMCHVRHIERLPLGMDYMAQIAKVQQLAQSPQLRGRHWLGVDGTGVGAGIVDMMQSGGLKLEAVTITHPIKQELVTALQAFIGAGALRMNPAMPLADVLEREMLNFDVQVSDAANAIYNARSGSHDDLVLALAIACRKIMQAATTSTFQGLPMVARGARGTQGNGKPQMPGHIDEYRDSLGNTVRRLSPKLGFPDRQPPKTRTRSW